jgi:hypothetical protein
MLDRLIAMSPTPTSTNVGLDEPLEVTAAAAASQPARDQAAAIATPPARSKGVPAALARVCD